MNGKSPNIPGTWVDPDDAPELGDDFFGDATPMMGDRVVSRDEFKTAVKSAIGRGRPLINGMPNLP